MRACAYLAALVWLCGFGAAADKPVRFPSQDGKTMLTGRLYRPDADEPRPALVLLHGCNGLGRNGGVFPVYRAWAQELVTRGYAVLLVDSATPRAFTATCTEDPARDTMRADRPGDAYGALAYLQAQPMVRAERIGVIGWSQGGGTVLRAIAMRDAAAQGDFRAAVALYPALCNDRMQSQPFVASVASQSWTTAVPLLILQGAADNWTPAAPCQAFAAAANARGAPVEFHLYADAHHTFDAPSLPLRARPDFRKPAGIVPIVGTNAAARSDALARVPAFLARHLGQ